MENNLDKILSIVSNQFSITVEEITGAKKVKKISRARHASICLVRIYLKYTLKQIGKEFGGRDHATIIYALKKWHDVYVSRGDFKASLNSANLLVAEFLNVKPINLNTVLSDNQKEKDRIKRRKSHKKRRMARLAKIKFEKLNEGGVIRSLDEMPIVKDHEWLKPLSRNKEIKKAAVNKPVYF
jgi:hypothetical protein